MTSKEKIIAEAWINLIGEENFKKIKFKINFETGFCEWGAFFKWPDFSEFHTRKDNCKDSYVRPKSLSGIENNNVWTCIESEADLPKEKSASYYWYDIRVKERMEALKMILEPVSLEYLKQLHRADICTHWKKAEVQPTPIY